MLLKELLSFDVALDLEVEVALLLRLQPSLNGFLVRAPIVRQAMRAQAVHKFEVSMSSLSERLLTIGQMEVSRWAYHEIHFEPKTISKRISRGKRKSR